MMGHVASFYNKRIMKNILFEKSHKWGEDGNKYNSK